MSNLILRCVFYDLKHSSIAVNPTPFCSIYPNALKPNPDNCAQFYDCRQQATLFGNYLRECPYLQLYSEVDNTCHSYTRPVNCGTRPEPKAPCKSKQLCFLSYKSKK